MPIKDFFMYKCHRIVAFFYDHEQTIETEKCRLKRKLYCGSLYDADYHFTELDL